MLLKILLAIGIVGHAINLYCDRIISIFPNGKLKFENLKDINNTEKMAQLMEGVSPKPPMRSAVLGAFALLLETLGYLAMAAYVYPQSHVCGAVLAAGALVFVTIGTAHHVMYCLAEWSFIRLGKNEKGTEVMLDLFDSAKVTYLCYAGYLAYVITLIVAVVTGLATVPVWMVIFTVLPLYLMLFPFRIIGTLHIAAMISMLAWLIIL